MIMKEASYNDFIVVLEDLKSDVKGVCEVLTGRMDGIDTRLDGIDTRLDGIDIRLDGIDTRLDGIDTRLDSIELRLAAHDERMKHLEQANLELLNEIRKYRFDIMQEKIDQLTQRVAELEKALS